jgi:hypothetical protein
MPQPIQALVVWDATLNKGTVADITVPIANGATVIQWSCGPNVASFTISDLDPTEFNPSSSGTDVTSFSTTDSGDTAKQYSYTVEATHAPTGTRSRHDPKITNES